MVGGKVWVAPLTARDRKDVQPLVPFMGFGIRLGLGCGDDDLPSLHAAWLPCQRNDRPSVRAPRLQTNPRVADLRSPDSFAGRSATTERLPVAVVKRRPAGHLE